MDKIPKFEDRDYAGWDQFFTTEFQRLGLTTHEQQAELVHAHFSAYLDTLDYDQLYMLRLSLLLEDNSKEGKNAGFLEMIAAQFAILEANGE